MFIHAMPQSCVGSGLSSSFHYILYLFLEQNSYMIKEQLFWCSGETAK